MNQLSIRDEMRKKFDKLQDDLYAQATLCYVGKPDGTIYVTERPGFIYVQTSDSPPIEVYNARVQPTLGLPVLVGVDPYEPWKLQVLSSMSPSSDATAGTTTTIVHNSYTGPHAPTHRFNATDPVWIDKRLILPARIGPTDIYAADGSVSGSAAIEIYPDIVTFNGLPYELPYQTVDLSAHVPGSGSSRFVNVSIASGGTVVITAGSIVNGNTPALTDAPACPSTNLSLGWVRLYGGMAFTNENTEYTDILDGRFNTFYASGSASTTAGHLIKDEGTPLTQRANLNFVGANVTATDDAGNNATVITITAGSASGGLSAVSVADSTTIDFTVTSGSQISGSVIPGGIPLDTLGATTNITTLDTTTTAHGLMPRLSGSATLFFNGAGGQTAPSAAFVGDFNIWMPDAKPSSPNALDDEFDNLSIAGTWSVFDPGGTFAISEDIIGLRMDYDDSVPGAIGGIINDNQLVADTTMWIKAGTRYPINTEIGIMLGQDQIANPNTSDILTFGVRQTPGGDNVITLKLWTAYNATPTVLYTDTTYYHAPVYLRLGYSYNGGAPTVFGDYSWDGISWLNVGALAEYSMTFVPKQRGIFTCEFTGGHPTYSTFGFFRVTGDYINDIMYGNRVAMKHT